MLRRVGLDATAKRLIFIGRLRDLGVFPMRKELFIYSTVFILSLGLAYWASLPTSNKAEQRQAVLSLSAGQIGGVDFSSSEIKVSIKQNESKKWWIETDKAGVKDRFLSSNKIQDVLAQFNPLEAVRVIGEVKDDGLAEYGLKDSTKSLSVVDAKGDVQLTLKIGKQAFGTRNVYVQESKNNKVLLMSGDIIGDVERPETKLFERTMTNVVMDEVQKASLELGQATKVRKFAHTKRDDKGATLWTDEAAEGATVVSAKSWFERLDRVRIVSFATSEEVALLDKDPVLFAVDLESAAAKDRLIFKKRAGASTPQGPVTEYFVNSAFLGVWAKVASTRLEPLEKDLATVLGESK